ncbi:response regulator transcription factor [Streptomyces yaizuensis]|uniref:Response regulator transcription factor n=1 Tax=Streptomyces yaizuensis TaxID=2989713 RepID=A0ABQ5P8C1_9ACTN|nr:response regulator transcription factor [Streptomyces sp. YSPA8]GLF98496.1 response regulator transcription factor [Streptomyces sp. YSPA8]
METRKFEDDWLTNGSAAEPEVRILLADQDPISRHVLGRVVRRAEQLRLVVSVDVRQPLRDWRLNQVDVAVLGVGHNCDPVDTIRELVAGGIRVLLIGVGWTRGKLDAAFQAGAMGCLLKDARISGLAAAARAVASGHTVLSPELHELYRSPSERRRGVPPSPDRPGGGESTQRLLSTLTDREREVLALLTDGLSTSEAAARLHVSAATIKSHVSHTLTKLGVRNRLEAVLLMQGAPVPVAQQS